MTFEGYRNIKTFSDDIWPMWAQIMTEMDVKTDTPKKEVARAFQAYDIATQTNLPLIILGSSAIREDQKLLQNVGTLATSSQYNQKVMRAFFKSLGITDKKVTESHLTHGSVMFDSNWWLLRNDMFMLGAAHAGREFHLATPRGQIPTDDLLWENPSPKHSRGHPRVLGREILILKSHGYTTVNGGNRLGITFVPPKTPIKKSYPEVREELKSAQNIQEIKRIFEGMPEAREIEVDDASASDEGGGGSAYDLLSPGSLRVMIPDDLASIASTLSIENDKYSVNPFAPAAAMGDLGD